MIGSSKKLIYTIVLWWRDLQETPGPRAQLRRVDSISYASMQRPTIELCRKIGKVDDLERVALISAVLSHIKEDRRHETIAKSLGSPPSNPICSPLRFKRILEATSPDEQLTAFRRAVVLLKGAANVRDFTESILDFNDPEKCDSRRRRWLFDYFQPENSGHDEQNTETSLETFL